MLQVAAAAMLILVCTVVVLFQTNVRSSQEHSEQLILHRQLVHLHQEADQQVTALTAIQSSHQERLQQSAEAGEKERALAEVTEARGSLVVNAPAKKEQPEAYRKLGAATADARSRCAKIEDQSQWKEGLQVAMLSATVVDS